MPLLLCISELQNKGLLAPREILMLKAKECAGNSDISFQNIRGWREKFMKRETLPLQQRTIIGQKLPSEFETNLNEYHYIIGQGQRNQYALIQIDKIDETAFFQHATHLHCKFQRKKSYVTIKITGYVKLKELL